MRSAAFIGSIQTRERGDRTGASLRAACSASRAMTGSGNEAPWSGVIVTGRWLGARGSARIMDATTPSRAAASTVSTETTRRGGRTGLLSRATCCARLATAGSGTVARWSVANGAGRLRLVRGGARMQTARIPTRADTSTSSTGTRRQGVRTGAASRAACCATRATRGSGTAARLTGAKGTNRWKGARGDARTVGASIPARAGSSSRSTGTRRRGGRTGAVWRAACCASRATCGS
mmetsp:Transcript_21387/g.53695  ORF Transcript_21387/g.53695 Transcript_21387/m.53695 type:complete len:235 (+) Transcript_21387:118-822(+)